MSIVKKLVCETVKLNWLIYDYGGGHTRDKVIAEKCHLLRGGSDSLLQSIRLKKIGVTVCRVRPRNDKPAHLGKRDGLLK